MQKNQGNFSDVAVVALATGFGSGFSPVAPGTAGSLVGVLIFLAVAQTHWVFYLAFTLLVVIAGIPIATRAEKIFGKKDSGKIVIDEIAGQLIALFGAPSNAYAVAGGFLLFRFFDIVKPFRRLEKLEGGLGVMIDDVVAGAFALITLQLLLAVL